MTKLQDAARAALEALERYQVKRQDFDRFADEVLGLRAALAADEAREPVVPAEWEGFSRARDAQAEQPVAWNVTYLGELTGNYFGIESRAHDELGRLNRLYPDDADKRGIAPLYASPQPEGGA
jgi:hypothetical protein